LARFTADHQRTRLSQVRFKAEPGLGEEPVDQRGPVLDALEPVPDDGGQLIDGAGGEVAQYGSRTWCCELREGAWRG
jgi:hypothetical protein